MAVKTKHRELRGVAKLRADDHSETEGEQWEKHFAERDTDEDGSTIERLNELIEHSK